MFGNVDEGRVEDLLTRLDGVLDDLSTLDVSSPTDDCLLSLLEGLEKRVNRLATVDHALLAEIDERNLGVQRGCGSTAGLLVRLLRVGVYDARARVRAASELAPKTAMTGERLQPHLPSTAAGMAQGEISPAHARIISRTLKALPAEVRDEVIDDVEPDLANYARQFGVDQFAQVARHLESVVNPDGILREAKYRERNRHLRIHQREDGSVHGSFDGTAEFGETLQAALDKTAAPQPAEDGTPDQRTPEQRQHDGLLAAMELALRAAETGDCNGVTTTVIVICREDDLETGTGLAHTGHGGSVPVQDILDGIGDTRLMPVRMGPPNRLGTRPIAEYGTSHRIFTERQRLAMIARDQGCAFPGCTIGPAWCQAHHVTDWNITQRTSVDDG